MSQDGVVFSSAMRDRGTVHVPALRPVPAVLVGLPKMLAAWPNAASQGGGVPIRPTAASMPASPARRVTCTATFLTRILIVQVPGFFSDGVPARCGVVVMVGSQLGIVLRNRRQGGGPGVVALRRVHETML